MRLLSVALLAAALAPAASAQRVADRLDDLRLATAVRLALVDDARTRALDVAVTARGGGVEIAGEVPTADRRTVVEVARAVPGVRVLGGTATGGAAAMPAEPGGPTVRVRPRPTDPSTPTDRPASDRARPAGPVYHTVERGDTLFGLARRYQTSVEAIQALNDRQSDGIRVGQRLRVR